MSETVLTAEIGRRAGSSDSRRLRAAGKIPAVVYGHGMDPLTISIDRRELRQALSGAAGMNTILDLTVEGTVYPTLIKDIQRHPVRRSVQHIDFIQVNLNEEIVVAVPIHLEGEAKAVVSNNGLVDLSIHAGRGGDAARRLTQGEALRIDPDGRLDRLMTIPSDRFPVARGRETDRGSKPLILDVGVALPQIPDDFSGEFGTQPLSGMAEQHHDLG